MALIKKEIMPNSCKRNAIWNDLTHGIDRYLDIH